MTRVLAALLLATTGCSSLFVSGPGAPAPTPPECTTVNLFPVIDSAGAVVFGIASLALFAISSDSHVSDEDRGVLQLGGVLYGASAIGLGFSASGGYAKTRRCRQAQAEWGARRYPGYPHPYPMQPYPSPAQPYPAQPYPAQPYPAQPYPAPAPYAPSPYAPPPTTP